MHHIYKLLINKIIILLILVLFSYPAVSDAKLIGPYSGQILDNQTGEPVKNASVLFYWTKEILKIMDTDSKPIDVKLLYADKNGKYEIPAFFTILGLKARYESVNIIVYQPGYQVFIKKIDVLNPYSKPDPEFKEIGYVIRLHRIPANFDHYKHVDRISDSLWGIDDEVKYRLLIDKFERRFEWEYRRGLFEKYGEKE